MANNPTLLTMPIAENGQKNTIPATQEAAGDGLLSQSTGFPPETSLPLGAGGVAPKREDFNGAFHLLSDIAFYAQKGWVFKWDKNQAYFVGCEVIDEIDGFKYRCIQDVAAGGDAPSADGAVHWRLVIEGEYIGSIKPCLQTSIPDGWLSLENGQLVLRDAYPELWAWVQDNAPLITEAQWQTKAAAQKSVGYYSSGDGSTTFRLPRLVGFFEGTTAANVGAFTAAGVPNIGGLLPVVTDQNMTSNGCYEVSYKTEKRMNWGSTGDAVDTGVSFDASRSNPIYGASDTVQPESVGMVWCVRAFGAATNQGTVDITELAQMLNLKLSIADAPRVCTPFAFPSDTWVAIPLPSAYSTYVAPADGYVFATGFPAADSIPAYAAVSIKDGNGNYILRNVSHSSFAANSSGAFLPVRKGDTVYIDIVNSSSGTAKFIYAVGEV